MRSRIFYTVAYFAIVGLLFVGAISIYAQTTIEDNVSVTATVAQENIVIFSGDACLSCQVFLLMDGSVADSTTSHGDGSFQLDIEDIDPVTHQFGVYAVDDHSIHSGTTFFSVDVSQGAIIYISDILVSPTLKVNSAKVEEGDNALLSGYTVPSSDVTIEIDGGSLVIQVSSASDGGFYHNLDTSNLAYASHSGRAMVETATDTSGYSQDVTFEVVEKQAEDEEESDEEDDAEETDITTEETTGEIIETVDEIDETPESGKPVDFAVVMANKNSQVISGEYLEMRIVILDVAEQFQGKEGSLVINIVDATGVELYHDSYDLLLNKGQKLEKKAKIHCPEKEGDYVIGAEIEIDGQRVNEGATAFVSKGTGCGPMKTGLETSLIAQNVSFFSLCAYIDWLIALLVVLLVAFFVMIFLLLAKKKEDDGDQEENLDEDISGNSNEEE